MARADLTVFGAGIFGLSIAWACTLRGAKVQVIDPFGPAAGASGGIVGALAPHVPENWNDKKAFQLDSLLIAPAFWEGVEAASSRSPGYARLGRLQAIPDQKALDLARRRSETAQALWQGRALWEVIPANSTGWAPQSATGWLIHDSLSARIHPRQACAALVAALASRDCQVMPEGAAQGQVIRATGVAGLQEVSTGFGDGVKGQAALLRLDRDRADRPQIFADALHIVPHEDGTIAIGSTSEREYQAGDTVDAALEDVLARAFSAVPELRDGEVIERWAGLRPRSKSRAPVLGPHPSRPGEFIANGGFKIGFGMAPKVAEVMADLVLEGVDNIPPGFHPRASL